MLKFVITVFVLISILSNAISEEDAARMETYKKLIGIICVPNLAADKAKIVTECENLIPKTGRDVYASCIKESLGIQSMTLASFCYKTFPNAEKLMECLKLREEEAKSHGIVIDDKMKESFKTKYIGCMAKAL